VKPYARSRRCKGGQHGIRPGDNDRSDRAINVDLVSAGWPGMIGGESS
jgi:hypothetical protein